LEVQALVTRTRRKAGQTQADHLSARVNTIYVDIGDIQPYERNPRDNTQAVQSVANSIRTFGFVVPIILDTQGVIVAGHTRYAAAVELGLTEVPVIRATHLSPDQIRQFRIIDNKVSELARWDFDPLAGELTALADSGLDFTGYGFSAEELDCMTDLVSDDCLSAGAAASLDQDHRQRRQEHRAPSQTRFVMGEIVFFLPAEVYRRWMSQLRAENDFSEADIVTSIKDSLGVTPYEEAYRRENG
jgi:hypothetical protein